MRLDLGADIQSWFLQSSISTLFGRRSSPTSSPGRRSPPPLWTFTLCLAVAFVGAMLLAISQADTPSLSLEIFDSGSLLAAGLALPVPVLWALSGSLVGKWFADVDESACVAVTFITAAAVVVPVTLAIAYAQSGLTIKPDILPAIALLAAGTILATGFGRVLYQKALTVTDNNNGLVSFFSCSFLRLPVSCPCGCRVGSASSNLRSAPFSSSALARRRPHTCVLMAITKRQHRSVRHSGNGHEAEHVCGPRMTRSHGVFSEYLPPSGCSCTSSQAQKSPAPKGTRGKRRA